jgi:hypothetical protein
MTHMAYQKFFRSQVALLWYVHAMDGGSSIYDINSNSCRF